MRISDWSSDVCSSDLSFETSFPITATDIRRWAIATYWGQMPPRLFWDEEYARTTRWGGIVAPEDFNPFAWQLPRELTEEELRLQGAIPGQETQKGDNILNGGQVDRFGARMRPGDAISSPIGRASCRGRVW